MAAAIAVHFYDCNGTTDASAAAAAVALSDFLERVYRRYHKPIWLTEWSTQPPYNDARGGSQTILGSSHLTEVIRDTR